MCLLLLKGIGARSGLPRIELVEEVGFLDISNGNVEDAAVHLDLDDAGGRGDETTREVLPRGGRALVGDAAARANLCLLSDEAREVVLAAQWTVDPGRRDLQIEGGRDRVGDVEL